MTIPCPTKVTCPSPGTGFAPGMADDVPLTSYSSEQDDAMQYVKVLYAGEINLPPLSPFNTISACKSDVSQADADVCAQAAAVASINAQLIPNEEQTSTTTCEDGTVLSYTVAAGTFFGEDQVKVNAQAKALADSMVVCTVYFTTDSVLTVGEATTGYSAVVAAINGTAPYTYTIDPTGGSLPTGLTLDPATGVISGIPTLAEPSTDTTYTFTVIVTDSIGRTASKIFTMRIKPPVFKVSIVWTVHWGDYAVGANIPSGGQAQTYAAGSAFSLASQGNPHTTAAAGAYAYCKGVWSYNNTSGANIPCRLDITAISQVVGATVATWHDININGGHQATGVTAGNGTVTYTYLFNAIPGANTGTMDFYGNVDYVPASGIDVRGVAKTGNFSVV